MSLQKPLEGLLRPPLEWYTTGIAVIEWIILSDRILDCLLL